MPAIVCYGRLTFAAAGAVAFGVTAGRAAGDEAGAAAFGVAVVFAVEPVLAFDRFVTDPVLAFAAGVAAGVPTDAGRAPLRSLGFSTTFLARRFSMRASFIAIAW